jgi:hypothetical protein
MDPDEKLGPFGRSLLKREARRFLDFCSASSCKSLSKIPQHPVQLLAIQKRITNAGMKFIAP